MLPKDTATDAGTKRIKAPFAWKDWLVPPVLFPLLLVGMILAYALLRTVE